MGRLDGKVVLVTGAAGGIGRRHVIRLAEEGANLVAVDICSPIRSVPYRMSTPEELQGVVTDVQRLGRRMIARRADVRDRSTLTAVLDEGVEMLGRLDVVVANAGIAPMVAGDGTEAWQDVIDVNLTGTFHTIEAALPHLIAGQNGGSIIITSSTAGLAGIGGASYGGLGYTASKHGVVGLMRSYANNLAPHSIRVNSVHPTGVATRMITDPNIVDFVAHDPVLSREAPNALPVDTVEPVDISNAVLWLASDESRYVTGVTLPVDAGFLVRR